MHRWRILVAATAGTAMLAAGIGITLERLVISAPHTPHLRTISDANLFARYGVTLSGSSQPPYCGLQQAVARSRYKPGAAGCAISREAAESAAVRGSTGSVVESLLARISSTSADVRDRLAWLVVVRWTPALQPQPMICAGPALGANCARIAQKLPDRVVFVDAHSGQYLLLYPKPPGTVPPNLIKPG